MAGPGGAWPGAPAGPRRQACSERRIDDIASRRGAHVCYVLRRAAHACWARRVSPPQNLAASTAMSSVEATERRSAATAAHETAPPGSDHGTDNGALGAQRACSLTVRRCLLQHRTPRTQSAPAPTERCTISERSCDRCSAILSGVAARERVLVRKHGIAVQSMRAAKAPEARLTAAVHEQACKQGAMVCRAGAVQCWQFSAGARFKSLTASRTRRA